MMLKPSTATMMITRNCTYRCEHCLIYRKTKDLEPSFWIEIGKRIHDKWNIHINLYGGEPLCYKGFEDIVSAYSKYGISYSINSSSRPLSRERANNLIKIGLINWTGSIDTLNDSRSKNGIRALELFSSVKDKVVEHVIFPGHVKDSFNVLRFAMENDYWVIASAVSFGLDSSVYDSWPKVKPIWSDEDSLQIAELVKVLKKYYRNHCPDNYLNILHTKEHLYQEIKPCKGKLVVFHPDYDGSMRLCRDVRGKRVRIWNMFDSIDRFEEFHNDWVKDYHELCQGCNWACPYFAKDREEIIKHV